MAMRLLATLQVPLRAQNEALRAAGLSPAFPEPTLDALDPDIQRAIEQMMQQQEPYPLSVLGGDFHILRKNHGAKALLGAFIAEPSHMPASPDMFTLFFDPRLVRPFVEDWDAFASSMLNRLHRELLQRAYDQRLQDLLTRVLAFPDLPDTWREPDFAKPAPAAQTLRLRRDTLHVAFLVTVTKFSAPQQVLLDELSIESCFPLDDRTRATCERLARP